MKNCDRSRNVKNVCLAKIYQTKDDRRKNLTKRATGTRILKMVRKKKHLQKQGSAKKRAAGARIYKKGERKKQESAERATEIGIFMKF